MTNFAVLENTSIYLLLEDMNDLDLNKWEIIGHPQSYTNDNNVKSSMFGGEGLQKLEPLNKFYIFIKNKNIEKIVV